MQTIRNDKVVEIEINKSNFIGFSFYVEDELEVSQKLEFVRSLHPKATHVCYGYKTIFESKCSDDGEPASTAGAPILSCITKQNLHNTLVVVVRYFGGIKLGAGGLVRAYGKVASNVLKESEIAKLLTFNEYNFIASYETYNNLMLGLNYDDSLIIENCNFKENVEGKLFVLENNLVTDKLQNELIHFKKIKSVMKRVE